MKKARICLVLALMIMAASSCEVLAHQGRLDSKGGHNVRTAGYGYPVGSYHYHYGSDRDTAYDANGNVISHNSGSAPAAEQKPASSPSVAPAPAPAQQPAAKPTQETAKAQAIRVFVDGEEVQFDQPPENINGRVMVPIRYVVEKMGCTVEWDSGTQTVYINDSGTMLEKAAEKGANINVRVNNNTVVFPDQQPVNRNGRILIPVSAVVEKLGYAVRWDGEEKIVFIDSQQSQTQITDIYAWQKYYKADDYKKYTTPASENGLDGTLLRIEGRIDDIQDFTDTVAYIISNPDEKWIIGTDKKIADFKTGDSVTAFGVYMGVSGRFDDTPALWLLRITSGDIIYSVSVGGIEYAVFYEGKSFEEAQALWRSE